MGKPDKEDAGEKEMESGVMIRSKEKQDKHVMLRTGTKSHDKAEIKNYGLI